jgi:hippurate hydrolase
MITRRVDVFDPAVVTIGKIASGTTNNVIPETVDIEGTIRTLSTTTRTLVHEQIQRVALGIGAAHGLEVVVTIESGFPVTVNDNAATELVIDVATRLVGANMVLVPEHPAMGAEDFSYVLEAMPGAMALLGTQPPDVALADVETIHSNKMVLNEQAMVTGIAFYAAMAASVASRRVDASLP